MLSTLLPFTSISLESRRVWFRRKWPSRQRNTPDEMEKDVRILFFLAQTCVNLPNMRGGETEAALK